MRIAYITAGAGGMFCGSCLHDNTLAAALTALGHDALLIPCYTPLRTDEPDVSYRRVFLGGINVYLQQKLALFRHTPRFLDRVLDARPLLRWVASFAVRTQAQELADLTISMLRGEHGKQRKEIARLVDWLADDLKPDIVLFSNVLLSGIVHTLRERWPVPVLATLQGDDVFLDALPEPSREKALTLVRDHCGEIDGFIATSRYYADFMADYLRIPREQIDVVYPGLNLNGHGLPRPDRRGVPFTIGYFARICPEKGLHKLIEAFIRLRQEPGACRVRLRVSGWLGANHRELPGRPESATWSVPPCSTISPTSIRPTTRARYASFRRSTCCRCRPRIASRRGCMCWRRWPTACRSCSRGTAHSPS